MKKGFFRKNYQRILGIVIKTVLVGIIAGIMFFNISPLLISNKGISNQESAGINKTYALDTGVAIPGHSGTTFADFAAYIKAVFDFSLKLGLDLSL